MVVEVKSEEVQHIVHNKLLTLSQLIVSRLSLINSGVVKTSITTINVILPELETEVLVINSFLSILIEKSQTRGHRDGSLRLILRYDNYSVCHNSHYASVIMCLLVPVSANEIYHRFKYSSCSIE